MKSIITVIALSLSLTSFAGGKSPVGPTLPYPLPTTSVSPLPKPVPSPIPEVKKVGIGFKCVDCTMKEQSKVIKAEKLANEIVQSKCFEDFVIKWKPIDLNGKTAKQFVQHLRTTTLEVPVHYYDGKCSVVGYRNVGEPDIYFNRCSHDYYNACDTGSNGTHEWSHVLGYDHPFRNTPTRGRTGPYTINHAFDACCKESQGFINHVEMVQ